MSYISLVLFLLNDNLLGGYYFKVNNLVRGYYFKNNLVVGYYFK